MSFIKKYKNKIIISVLLAVFLIFTFWWGGDSPALHGFEINPNNLDSEMMRISSETSQSQAIQQPKHILEGDVTSQADINKYEENETQKTYGQPVTAADEFVSTEKSAHGNHPTTYTQGEITYQDQNETNINKYSESDEYKSEYVSDGKPTPIDPENTDISDKELTCTLSVRCDTILENISWLDPEKVELVPENGVLFAEKTVIFYEGESVFNLLSREMKRSKIHLEFENTPIYNSSYIEGIGNLYEFDCGELSGWMYKVNGWFPNYGCSQYQLKNGDKVEWVYTCNLGTDVGGYYSARNGN